MKPFEIFSVVGITMTALLGLYNLYINIKSQRKTHRELFFNKQFDFFMNLQSLIAVFEDLVYDLNESHIYQDACQEQIFVLANDIDMLISKNELIIPDSLYGKLSDYSGLCHKIYSLSKKEPIKIDKIFKSELVRKNIDLLDDIREYIGIEQLSEENRKLVRGKKIED
jgi:hypothetical protein